MWLLLLPWPGRHVVGKAMKQSVDDFLTSRWSATHVVARIDLHVLAFGSVRLRLGVRTSSIVDMVRVELGSVGGLLRNPDTARAASPMSSEGRPRKVPVGYIL